MASIALVESAALQEPDFETATKVLSESVRAPVESIVGQSNHSCDDKRSTVTVGLSKPILTSKPQPTQETCLHGNAVQAESIGEQNRDTVGADDVNPKEVPVEDVSEAPVSIQDAFRMTTGVSVEHTADEVLYTRAAAFVKATEMLVDNLERIAVLSVVGVDKTTNQEAHRILELYEALVRNDHHVDSTCTTAMALHSPGTEVTRSKCVIPSDLPEKINVP
ncbi:hypothetical protein M231_06101 [Tremella mesenterica]|uniref:Uncharacterized protein n=1 Tax=Tremella mesenterica TaxID=5217 RepID=A0A4Q1BCR8_TREME|nr:hypothetical protein M231_06101 [Tremella mesenterica]